MKDKISNFFSNIAVFLKQTWIIILAVLIVVAAGISSVEIYKEEVLKIDPDVEYKESKTLMFSSEALDTLNPILSKSEDVYHLSKLIYNSLFDYDENLGVVPELVDTYSVETNRGKITLKLREDVKWHDGSRFTARDIQYTVNAINAAGSKSIYYDKASKITYIGIRGEYEAEIYFKNAYNASLDDLTFPILPASQYASGGALASADKNFRPVGTGQYQYQSYNYLKQLRLKPNPDYFGPIAEKKIKVMILPDRELSSNMLEINSVTCYVDTSTERKSIVTDKEFTMYDMVSNEVEFLVFHPQSAILKEKQMRQTVAYAINEQNVLENGYMNDGVLSDTIYYPNFLGVMDENTYFSYDPEKAATMLKDAGYKDVDQDGILENQAGKEIRLTIIVNKNNGTRLAAARLIKKDLERAGFLVDLQELTWKAYKAAISAGKYDILLTGYSVKEDYDLRRMFNGKSEWKYYNYQLLAKANELEKIYTMEEYQKAYKELKKLLIEELPYYSLCYKKIGLVGVSGFTASKAPMFNDHYKNCETWAWTYAVEAREANGEEDSEKNEEKSEDS
ncbi:MAG: ABC transporter substrate-binding protein [Firmicutes bacterium]|nr:ABC transporter substrate-binding protein [Bacillota bacterium]